MIDEAALTLAVGREQHLADDRGQGGGVRADRARQRVAAERPEAHRLGAWHLAGTQPFCYEQRLINLEAVPQVAKESFEVMPPGTWLLNSVPWSLAEHRIRASEADAETAAALKIRLKSAVLIIERRTRSAESTAITFVRLTYPGELHELVASFAPPTVAGHVVPPASNGAP